MGTIELLRRRGFAPRLGGLASAPGPAHRLGAVGTSAGAGRAGRLGWAARTSAGAGRAGRLGWAARTGAAGGATGVGGVGGAARTGGATGAGGCTCGLGNTGARPGKLAIVGRPGAGLGNLRGRERFGVPADLGGTLGGRTGVVALADFLWLSPLRGPRGSGCFAGAFEDDLEGLDGLALAGAFADGLGGLEGLDGFSFGRSGAEIVACAAGGGAGAPVMCPPVNRTEGFASVNAGAGGGGSGGR